VLSTEPYWDAERETLDPKQRERVILERIQHQLAYGYDKLPFYRRLYDAHGFKPDHVRTLDDFTTKVPVVTKKMLVADQELHPPFGSYAGDVPDEQVTRIHGSSGTSGTPTFYRVSKRDWDRAAELGAMSFFAAGVRPDDICQIGFPFSLFFGGWGVLQGLERIGATCFPLGALESERQIELMHRLGSSFFSATVSYCQHLVTVAERVGVDLSEGPVKRLVIGAEAGASILASKRRLSDGWGADVHDAASTSEMYPFMTNIEIVPGEGMTVFNDEVFTEIVDRNDPNVPVPYGTTGAVVYTHLWRESQPMIRFWPGDASMMVDDPGTSGRTYPRLPQGILGRLDDMLVVRGVNVYPTAIEAGLREAEGIGAEYQIVVSRPGDMDELLLRAEISHELARELATLSEAARAERLQELKANAEERIRRRAQLRVPVELLEPGTMPETVFKAKRVVDLRQEAVVA